MPLAYSTLRLTLGILDLIVGLNDKHLHQLLSVAYKMKNQEDCVS
jgi:hypothetical protein